MNVPLPRRQMTAAEARAARANARTYAGYRQARIAEQTGRLVVIVHAEEAGLDPADGDCTWYTICDDHGQLVGHTSLGLAREHAADPLGWCEVCNGADPGYDDPEETSPEG